MKKIAVVLLLLCSSAFSWQQPGISVELPGPDPYEVKTIDMCIREGIQKSWKEIEYPETPSFNECITTMLALSSVVADFHYTASDKNRRKALKVFDQWVAHTRDLIEQKEEEICSKNTTD